ncbi:MAG: SprT family zinc-dependent metalloprotease [Actinomycetota bacterium]
MRIHFEIKRAEQKKSVGFSVRWPDTMVVSAPARMDKKTLESMVAERLPWAERRLAKLAADYQRLGLPKEYVGGESFPYLGRQYPLTLMVTGNSARPKCSLVEDRLVAVIPHADEFDQSELARKALMKWYRRRAEEDLTDSVSRWAPVIGGTPATVRIRNQRTRWGSCSRAGAVNLNWRLIMLPPEVLDYIVVHELCHLVEPNHSPRFWAVVAKVIPHYKQRRTLLRRHSAYLDAF